MCDCGGAARRRRRVDARMFVRKIFPPELCCCCYAGGGSINKEMYTITFSTWMEIDYFIVIIFFYLYMNVGISDIFFCITGGYNCFSIGEWNFFIWCLSYWVFHYNIDWSRRAAKRFNNIMLQLYCVVYVYKYVQ